MGSHGISRRSASSLSNISAVARSAACVVEILERRCLLAAGTGLQADYFDNADFSGWKLTRTDNTVNFNWGTSSPDPQLAADTFSVRWTGQLQAKYTQTHTFYTTSDDGIRLWVNGQRLINNWTDHASTVNSATIDLVAGRRYDIVLEYRDTTGTAQAVLEWSSPSQAREIIPTQYLFPGKRGGLLREVWTGISGSALTDLTSNPAYPNSPTSTLLYVPAEIPANTADNYGDRLRGYVHAPVTGNYTFYLAADDQAALYLSNSTDPAGVRLIASVPSATNPREWTKYAAQRSVTIPLVAGQAYYLEVLHKEGTANDHLAIGWTTPGSSTISVIPSYDLSPLLPTVKLYQLQPAMSEGSGGTARIQVVREGGNIGAPLTVQYTTSGQATSGSDYSALPGTITIPAGAISAEIAITAAQDTLIEGSESVVVTLVDQPQYTLGTISSQQATATISDDDFAAPTSGVSALAADPLAAFNVWGTGTSGQVVTVAGPGFTRALQITTTTTPANPWDTQAQQRNVVSLQTGDVMLLEFVARATSGTARVGVVFERAGSPYTQSFSRQVTFTSEWTKFQFPFMMAEGYAANGAQLGLHLGFGPQSFQIAAVQLTRYGPAASMLPGDTVHNWGALNAAYGSLRTVAVSGQSFSQAFEVQTATRPPNVWDLQILRPTQLAVNQDETVYMEFYARSATASPATFAAFLQKDGNPWTKSGYTQRTVGSDWTLIRMPFTVAETYAAGAAQVGFFFGFDAQTVQIGGLKVVRVAMATPAIAADPLAAFSSPNSTYGTSQIVSVTGAPGFTQALQLTTTTVPASAADFAVSQPTTMMMKQGDTIFLEFYARATAGTARLNAVLRSTASPYTASLSSQQTLGTSWTLVRLPFTLAADYAAGQATLAFECGYGPQTLQIGRVRLTDISQALSIDLFPQSTASSTYGGRDANAAWRDTAQANIEQNRQAPITVTVLDQNGQRVDGVEVIIRQRSHQYTFGTEMDAGLIIRSTSADAEIYRNIARQYFNTVVLGNALKWPDWINDGQLAIDAANWVINNDMMLRGHNLIWPSRTFMPGSIWQTYDSIYASQGVQAAADYLRQASLNHIIDEATTMAGIPTQWDVVNEPYANHDVMDILGNAAMIDWFQAAAAADPNAQLYLNDYGIFDNHADTAHQNNFDYWINYLLTNGAPLHAIGEQSHFGAQPPDIDQLQPIVDRYARFGLPILITEFDINTPDEQLQADFLRDYFTFIFSQSSSIGILQWGFWENAHWLPQAALFRSDWSIKPNGQQYSDLIYGDWWSDLRGTTANGGVFSTRAFMGEYEIIVQKGQTITVQTVLAGDGANITVTLDVAPPTVSSLSINSGATQRSMVRRIDVIFSEAVDLSDGAISVRFSDGSAVPNVVFDLDSSADQRTYVLRFSGTGATGGSLPDGIFDLVISAAGVQDLAENAPAANYTYRFHRLFGDADGNKVVNASDYTALRNTFDKHSTDSGFNDAFDYDNNLVINASDLTQFRKRFNVRYVY